MIDYIENEAEINFLSVNLLTAIVDTDYENWAVFVQCLQEGGKNKFLSTRVMSRHPTLSPEHSLLARETIKVWARFALLKW